MSTIRVDNITNEAGTDTPAILYDNTTSGLTATDIKAAIDEVNSNALTSSSNLDATNLTGNVAAARITDALNAGGSAPIYACRAWVNFNGTGTVAIRASGNVSSITDNTTGDYTVNFATAMEDANYSLAGVVGNDGRIFALRAINSYPPTTTECRVSVRTDSAGVTDDSWITAAVFR